KTESRGPVVRDRIDEVALRENADQLHPLVFDHQCSDAVLGELAHGELDAVDRAHLDHIAALGMQDIGYEHAAASRSGSREPVRRIACREAEQIPPPREMVNEVAKSRATDAGVPVLCMNSLAFSAVRYTGRNRSAASIPIDPIATSTAMPRGVP